MPGVTVKVTCQKGFITLLDFSFCEFIIHIQKNEASCFKPI